MTVLVLALTGAALLLVVTLLLIPIALSLRAHGDVDAGLTVVLRYRILGLVTGTRTLREPDGRALVAAAAGASEPASAVATAPLDADARTEPVSPALGGPPDATDASADRPPQTTSSAAADTGRTSTKPPASTASWRAWARSVLRRPASVRRILTSRAIRVLRPSGWIELGLDDVAETGRVYGALCALAALVDPHGAIRITPCWNAEDWLAADVALRARVYPLPLLAVIAAILLEARRRDTLTAGSGVVAPAAHAS